MAKSKIINVNGTTITIFHADNDDYISLTDMARFKNAETTGLVISHWLSIRYTIEFMGLWEQMNNPDFNVTEFSNIRNESIATDLFYLQNNGLKKQRQGVSFQKLEDMVVAR